MWTIRPRAFFQTTETAENNSKTQKGGSHDPPFILMFTPPCRRDAGIIGSVFKLCSERHGKGGLGSFLLCTAGCVLPAP